MPKPYVRSLELTDEIPQADGSTLWRLQFTPKALAAAMNMDRTAQRSILARRLQPRPVQVESRREYDTDDPMAEAAAARHGWA